MSEKYLTDEEGEVRELTAEDFAKMRPAREFFTPEQWAGLMALQKRARGMRGAQIAPTKQQVTLRLDSDIIAHFKAGGRGWQTRLNAALKSLI